MTCPAKAQKETISCVSGLQSGCGILRNYSHQQATGCSVIWDRLDGEGRAPRKKRQSPFDLLTPGEENSTMFPPAFVLLDGSGLG